MSDNQIIEFKVFLASPSDVSPERAVAFQVIDWINHVLENLGSSYRFKIYAWEKHSHPDAGNPQSVILDQISIENCDVLVGIFWRRFGQAPGIVRKSDGTPYLSGTEVEINKAFQARKRSSRDRPIIMLYRKMDKPKTRMSDDEHDQYGRVIQFFRQCGPEGEHPALVSEFVGKDLAKQLEDHLLRLVPELDKDEHTPTQPTTPSLTSLPMTEADPLMRWLELVNLNDNPFKHLLAQNEKQSLPRYFVPLREVQISGLLNAAQPWVLFAEAGYGKTTLRTILSAYCYPHDSSSKILCTELALDRLEAVMQYAKGSLEHLDPIDVVQVIESLATESVPALGLALNKSHAAQSALMKDPRQRLSSLIAVAQNAGFHHLLCVVDEVDEPNWVHGQPEKMARLLSAVMAPAVREVSGITFGYLLPQSVKPLLQNQRSVFRLDRCRVIELKWSKADLQKLIRQRMIYFSRDQSAPYQSLGELCEIGNFSENIDDEISALAESSPRAAMWLANRLIESHCTDDPAQASIQRKTWERVKVDWWAGGRAQIFGGAESHGGFRILNEKIYFQGNVVELPTLYDALLRCLIQADGNICTDEQLAHAGWPQKKRKVKSGTLAETIRRTKLALKKKKIDPRWIQTVRGKGYRIHPPDASR